MKGVDIAGLLIKFGPIAFDWAQELADIWNKEMTPEEVKAFCLGKRKGHDDYVAAEQARRAALSA